LHTLHNFKGHPRSPTAEYADEWQVGYFNHDPSGHELYKPVLGTRCRIMQESGEFTEWSTWLMATSLSASIAKEEHDASNN
jgi:hypothetical protein